MKAYYIEKHLSAINSAPHSAKTVTQEFEDFEVFEEALDDPRNNGKGSRGYSVDSPVSIVGYGAIINGKKIDCTRQKAKELVETFLETDDNEAEYRSSTDSRMPSRV